MPKDSAPSTKLHIEIVNDIGTMFISKLIKRLREHDASKLQEPEKSLLDGSPDHGEYATGTPSQPVGKSVLRLQAFLQHHYAHNRHHPEHFPNGIDDMNLIDIIEMYIDWCAATLRGKNGTIFSSIHYNKKRFNMSPQLERIFLNTAFELEDTMDKLRDVYPEGEGSLPQSEQIAGD